MIFASRSHVGSLLAEAFVDDEDVLVLALPRGGAVVGAEIALKIGAPLGLVLVKKLGHPAYPEYAIGALAEDDEPIYNDKEVELVNHHWLDGAVKKARELIAYRRELYYGTDFVPPRIEGKTVILVDDGIATGFTMEAAINYVRKQNANKVIVAAAVAPSDTVRIINKLADEVVLLDNPENFMGAIAAHYTEFPQVDDQEVQDLLRKVKNELRQQTPGRKTLTGAR